MNLYILPEELLKEIAQWLMVKDLVLLGSTSKWFNAKSYSWPTTASIHDIPSHNNYAILEKLGSIEDLDNDPDPDWMDNIRGAPALIPQLTRLSKLKKLRCGIYPRREVPGPDTEYIMDQIDILKQLTTVEQLALSVSNMIPRAYGINLHDICNNLTRLTSLSLLAGFLEDRDHPWAIFSQLCDLELQFMHSYEDEYFGNLRSIEKGTNLTKLVIANYAYSSYGGQMARISHLTRLKCLEIACPTPALIDGTDLTRLSHLRELFIGYADSEDNRLSDIIPSLESLRKLRVHTLDSKFSSLTNLSHLIIDSRYDNQKNIIDNIDSLMKMTALRRLDLPYTDEFMDTIVENVTQLQRIYTPVHAGRGRGGGCHFIDHRRVAHLRLIRTGTERSLVDPNNYILKSENRMFGPIRNGRQNNMRRFSATEPRPMKDLKADETLLLVEQSQLRKCTITLPVGEEPEPFLCAPVQKDEEFEDLRLALNQNIAETKAANEAHQTNYESLKTNHESLKTDYESLKTDYKSLKTNHESLKKRHESLKKSHDALNKRHNETSKKYKQTLKNNNELAKEVRTLKDSIGKLQEHTDSLESGFEEVIQAHNVAHNVTTAAVAKAQESVKKTRALARGHRSAPVSPSKRPKEVTLSKSKE